MERIEIANDETKILSLAELLNQDKEWREKYSDQETKDFAKQCLEIRRKHFPKIKNILPENISENIKEEILEKLEQWNS